MHFIIIYFCIIFIHFIYNTYKYIFMYDVIFIDNIYNVIFICNIYIYIYRCKFYTYMVYILSNIFICLIDGQPDTDVEMLM